MVSTRLRRLTAAASLVLLTTGSAWALGAPSASAAGTDRYVATTGSDTTGNADNTCAVQTAPCKTIQHAVDSAGSGDTVHVGAGSYAESVLIGAAELDPAGITIAGAGAEATKVTGNPAGSGSIAFGFNFENVPATLRDLAVTGVERASGSSTPAVGVEVEGTSATFTDVDVSGNADGGVIAQNAVITATGSHFDHNGTSATQGLGFAGCGVIVIGGAASVDTSSASSNALCGVAVLGGLVVDRRPAADAPAAGLVFARSTAADNTGPGLLDEGAPAGQVTNSTLSGNGGGGLYVTASTVSVVHSTITDTQRYTVTDVPDQAAIAIEDQVAAAARIASPSKVNHTLRALSRHSSVTPRLRAAAAAPSSSTVTVSGSIVADNDVPDCSQHITDGGYNLSRDAANSCGFSTAKHSLTKTNPKLGRLGNHGGATQTQLPLKASPAIDAEPGGTADCSDAARDQRGVLRPQPTGGRCDLGSVELAAEAIAISPQSLPHGTVGKAYTRTITATGGQYPTYTWSLASGDLPDGLAFSSHGVLSGTPTKAGTFTFVVSVNDPVLKRYTIVIDAPAGTNGNGTAPLANTGSDVTSLAVGGTGAVLAGLMLLLTAGRLGRSRARHRPVV
jgi:large repetitive protein